MFEYQERTPKVNAMQYMGNGLYKDISNVDSLRRFKKLAKELEDSACLTYNLDDKKYRYLYTNYLLIKETDFIVEENNLFYIYSEQSFKGKFVKINHEQ